MCATLNLSVRIWPLSVPSWACQAGCKCWRLSVLLEGLTTCKLSNIFSPDLTFSNPELRWWMGLKIGSFSSGPLRIEQNWFAFNCVTWDDAALPWRFLYVSLMIDWVLWMAQWLRTLKQCHGESGGFTLSSTWQGEKNQKGRQKTNLWGSFWLWLWPLLANVA